MVLEMYFRKGFMNSLSLKMRTGNPAVLLSISPSTHEHSYRIAKRSTRNTLVATLSHYYVSALTLEELCEKLSLQNATNIKKKPKPNMSIRSDNYQQQTCTGTLQDLTKDPQRFWGWAWANISSHAKALVILLFRFCGFLIVGRTKRINVTTYTVFIKRLLIIIHLSWNAIKQNQKTLQPKTPPWISHQSCMQP